MRVYGLACSLPGAAATPSETEEPTKPVSKTAPVEVAKLLVAFEGIDKFIELLRELSFNLLIIDNPLRTFYWQFLLRGSWDSSV